MALNPKFSTTAVNAKANAIGDALDMGYIRVYDGVQPADANTGVTTQTLLAELRFGPDAWQAAVGGVIVANAITEDASADATGTATWGRVLAADGTTVWFDGSVGTSSANIIINSTSIVAGGLVSCSGMTLTENPG